MPKTTISKSNNFIDLLITHLGSNKDWELERWFPDRKVDLAITDRNTGKRILIDIRDAKEYGELPIASINSIANLVRNHVNDTVLLVSLSDISPILAECLEELNIRSLKKPSVQRVFEEVTHAIAS